MAFAPSLFVSVPPLLFYYIFFVTSCTFTGVTFTDPLTCSFLILSYIVTPTPFPASSSRQVYVFGLSLLTMYLRHTVIQALPMFCITSPLVVWSSFCHTTLHCTASRFPTFSALSNLHSINFVCVLLTLIPLSSNAFLHNSTHSVIINLISSIQDHIVCICH